MESWPCATVLVHTSIIVPSCVFNVLSSFIKSSARPCTSWSCKSIVVCFLYSSTTF